VRNSSSPSTTSNLNFKPSRTGSTPPPPLPSQTPTRWTSAGTTEKGRKLCAMGLSRITGWRTASLLARPVSPSQRAQWRKDGNCVRCGSQDHWVENCQLQPTVQLSRQPFRQPFRQSVSSRQLSRPSPVPGYYYPDSDKSDASNYGGPHSMGEITL